MSDTTPTFVCPNGCSYKMEQLHRRIVELEAQLHWLDNNTTHYLTDESDGPVLASVSRKIWYHATDDVDSYPFSEVIKKALGGEDET